MASYTVPLEIIGTDPVQTEGWAKNVRAHVSKRNTGHEWTKVLTPSA